MVNYLRKSRLFIGCGEKTRKEEVDTKDKAQLEYQEKRKRRVKRMKRNLIIILVIMLLVPTVTCIFLSVKIAFMQKQIDYLYEAKFGDGKIGSAEESPRWADSGSEYSLVNYGTESINSPMADGSITGDTKNVRRKIYLTFDDGPSDYTEEILEILDDYDVKATFFVIGREDEKLLPYYKKIVDKGHTIALHSYSHKYSEIYNDLDSFKEDFYKIQTLVEEKSGVKPTIYRFPGGSSNQVSKLDMKEFIKFLNEEGVVYYDWNAANGDATSKKYTVSELVNNVLNGINKEGNTVVLMHDTNAKGTTVDSLPILLKKLKEMDVDIVPIDNKTKPVQHIRADSVN